MTLGNKDQFKWFTRQLEQLRALSGSVLKRNDFLEDTQVDNNFRTKELGLEESRLLGLSVPIREKREDKKVKELHIPCTHSQENVNSIAQEIIDYIKRTEALEHYTLCIESVYGEPFFEFYEAVFNQDEKKAAKILKEKHEELGDPIADPYKRLEYLYETNFPCKLLSYTGKMLKSYKNKEAPERAIEVKVQFIDFQDKDSQEHIQENIRQVRAMRKQFSQVVQDHPIETISPQKFLDNLLHSSSLLFAHYTALLNPARNKEMLTSIRNANKNQGEKEGLIAVYGSNHEEIYQQRESEELNQVQAVSKNTPLELLEKRALEAISLNVDGLLFSKTIAAQVFTEELPSALEETVQLFKEKLSVTQKKQLLFTQTATSVFTEFELSKENVFSISQEQHDTFRLLSTNMALMIDSDVIEQFIDSCAEKACKAGISFQEAFKQKILDVTVSEGSFQMFLTKIEELSYGAKEDSKTKKFDISWNNLLE